MMNPLMMLWFLVLPTIGITALILAPIWWFIVVPKVARTLTWARFGNKTLIAFGDDEGWAYIMPSKESLPEGVVRTRTGYHFLPRGKHKDKDDVLKKAGFMFRKFILRDLGKPLWFGYTGKCGVMNPETLAVTSGVEVPMGDNPTSAVVPKLESMIQMIKILPSNVSKETKKQMMKITVGTIKELKKPKKEVKELTVVDPTKIKELIPTLYTPSQLDVVAMNRFNAGMKRAGSQIGKYVLGFGVLILLMVVAIVAILAISGGGIFGGGSHQAQESAGVAASSLATVVHCLF